MALNLMSFDPILKELYDRQKVIDLVYPSQPFFAMLDKYEKFEGDAYPLPLKIENNQSISSTFAAGNAETSSSIFRRFNLTRNRKYGFARIGGEVARASASDKGAFIQAIKIEIDSTKKGVVDAIAAELFGDGTGKIGTVTSYTASSNTLVLSIANEISNIHVGMLLQFTAANGTTVRAGGTTVGGVPNTFSVVSRDAVAGSFTLNADPTAIVATDLIFRAGDRGNAASGLQAWLPSVAPGSTDSFFGVNRSADRSRLAGIYVGTAASDSKIETTLIEGVSLLNREGGRPDMIWISFSDYAALVVELGAKVQYDRIKPMDGLMGDFGFEALKLHTAFGFIKVMADQHCPKGQAFVLEMDSWKLYSLGMVPMIDNLDGNQLLRANDDDSVVARILAYYQLGCNAPGHNAHLVLPA